MGQRVKTYDYIKRSDISVLKATIDGKVLDVDPKTILSGTYVAGKIKPTAAKLRVAKVDPEKLRIKMLNMYEQVAEKKYNADFEKYVTVADIQKFVECGMTEEMVMAFYCGIQSIMEIKADNEFAYRPIGGIFDFRTDEDGKWIKNYIERGIANCENNVFELGFKYPSFDWKKVGMKIPKTDIIETLPFDFFGKERKTVLRIETFNVKTNFKVLAIKAIADIESGNKKPRSGSGELLDPKTTMDLNGGYLSIVSRNGKELFALAKKLLSQEKSYLKDFEWVVQNKTGGAEDLIEKDYKFANGGNINAEIDGLQKGDTITIEYGSSINKDNKVTLKVRSRNKVRKGTIDKITFDNTNNPSGVKFYAYNRGKGWSFAIGDMGISNVKIVSTYAEGGSIETIKRLNGNRQEYTLPLPKISILTSEINDTALTWIEDNTGLKFRKTAWAYEAQPQKSEQIVKLLTMYGFVTEFHNNATNKNVLFLKFFKDEFMQYAKGGVVYLYYGGEREDETIKVSSQAEADKIAMENGAEHWDYVESYAEGGKLAKRGLHKATSTGDSIADWAFNFDPKKRYAKGGVTEHGLKVGDTITDDLFWENRVVVKDKGGKKVIVDLEKGKRGVKYATGGNVPRFYLSDEILNSMSSSEYDDLYLKARRWQMQEVGGGEMFSLPEALYLIYYDQNFPKGSKERRESWELYKKYALDKKANGGGIEDIDFMASARTSARDSIDWSEELRNFAGENYDSLSELEKESIIADMQRDWDFQHSFAKGGSTYAEGGEIGYSIRGKVLRKGTNDVVDEHLNTYIEASPKTDTSKIKERAEKILRKDYPEYDDNAYSWRLEIVDTKYAKGGKLDEIKYIPRDEIIKVELKNGKVIVNSWNNPIYSGLRIGKGITEREEMEEQGQLAMFKRGGKMPKYAQYVSQRDIAKVYLYDEDEPTEISGRDLVGGIYFDNEKATKLIEMARKRGLIK